MLSQGVFDYESIKSLIYNEDELDVIMFKVEYLTRRLSDAEIHDLCDYYFKHFQKLVDSNNLFVYLHHLNQLTSEEL